MGPSAWLLGVLLGCRDPAAPRDFAVLIEAHEVQGEPVAGVVVRGEDRHPLGHTDGRGHLLLSKRAREGDNATYLLAPPPGMRLVGPDIRRVVLRQTRGLGDVPGPATEFISVDVTVRQRTVPYVLLVDAGSDRKGLPVLVSGAARGSLNSQGVAMLVHDGLPGDEVTLRLLTGDDPRLRPRDPERTFVLPEAPSPLLWRQELVRLPLLEKVRPVRRSSTKKRPVEI